MSVHVMSWVLRHSEETLGARLVLLVLADHAREDGTHSWSSVATIAKESRLSRSQVQRCLRGLEERGAIIETGKGPTGTHEYSVVMEGPQSAAGAASSTEGGRTMRPEPSVVQPSTSLVEADASTRPVQAEYHPRRGRKIGGRNLPWDALVEVTQANEKAEAGRIAAALRRIRAFADDQFTDDGYYDRLPEADEIEAHIAELIRERGRLYDERWPNVELTPSALAANWFRVITDKKERASMDRLQRTHDIVEAAADAARQQREAAEREGEA